MDSWPFCVGAFVFLSGESLSGWYFIEHGSGVKRFVFPEWEVESVDVLVCELLWRLPVATSYFG